VRYGVLIPGYRAHLTVMVNGDVHGGAPSDLSAGGQRLSNRSEGCGVGAAGTADPRDLPGLATDMRGDERPLLFARTGCPWRYLPRDSFPPRSTVYNIFRKFRRDDVWGAIWAELHMALRERMGREASPSRLRFSTANQSSRRKRGQ